MNGTSELVFTRGRLNDAVFRQVGEDIVRGVLPAGEALQDAAIAFELGVSRTPVREALLRLERVGLVIIHASRRTVVSPLDEESLRDSLRWAEHLATTAVREAMPRLSGADREACAVHALAVPDAAADAYEYASAQFALVLSIAERSGSAILLGEVREWEFVIRRALGARAQSKRSALSVSARYRELADAIRADDAEGVVQILASLFGDQSD
ncbi:MAG: GntR family transcriptional regulator [Actinomycetota bacterium]